MTAMSDYYVKVDCDYKSNFTSQYQKAEVVRHYTA